MLIKVFVILFWIPFGAFAASINNAVLANASFVLSATDVIGADAWQDFSGGDAGSVFTSSQLNSGQTGTPGNWNQTSMGAGGWVRTNAASVNFRTPRTNGASSIYETGDHWAQMNHGTTTTEQMEFRIGISSTNNNGILTAFMVFSATNTVDQTRNLDHIQINGDPFVVLQQSLGPTSNPSNVIRVHTQDSGSNSQEGSNITIVPGKLYWIMLMRDRTNTRAVARLYDCDTWTLTGESAYENMGPDNYTWTYRIMGHYIEGSTGNITGYTRIGGVTFTVLDSKTTSIPDP
jgi:hypothetical protein